MVQLTFGSPKWKGFVFLKQNNNARENKCNEGQCNYVQFSSSLFSTGYLCIFVLIIYIER